MEKNQTTFDAPMAVIPMDTETKTELIQRVDALMAWISTHVERYHLEYDDVCDAIRKLHFEAVRSR